MVDAAEFVVRDDVSRFGLRRVHVIRAGGPVDEGARLEALGVRAEELLGVMVYEEEDTGMWHWRAWWKE